MYPVYSTHLTEITVIIYKFYRSQLRYQSDVRPNRHTLPPPRDKSPAQPSTRSHKSPTPPSIRSHLHFGKNMQYHPTRLRRTRSA